MTYVMWTTRTDMVENHWIPNHFVALLPKDVENAGETQNLETTISNATREQIGIVGQTTDTLEEIQYENAEDVKTLEERLLEATIEQKNTDGLIQDTPEERQGLNTITEQKNTDDSQIADTPEEIQNKDAEEKEKIKTLEATNLNASKEQKKTSWREPKYT